MITLAPPASESAIQRAVAELIDHSIKPGFCFAVPNNEVRPAPGMRGGAADLCLLLPDGSVAFIEVKAKRGRQSPVQRDFEARCNRIGVPYAVVRSVDEALAFLQQIGATRRRAA